MRIGLLIHSLEGGGAEAVARLWVAELARRDHYLVCLVFTPTASEAALDGAEVVTFADSSARQRWVRLPGWVRRTVREHCLDVVVSLLDFANITLLRALAGRSSRPALVLSEHSVPDLMWRHEGPAGNVKRLMAKSLYRHADAVIAVSHAVATDLRVAHSVRPDRLFVLPNAIGGLTDICEQRDSAADPAGTRPAEPRLIYVGRLAPEKRPDRFLATLAELHRRDSGWHGLMIGAGPSRPELTEWVRRNQLRVEFAGWVQPWQWMARSGDCLLLTSDVEGLGNVLVEAAAAGVRCVAPSTALGVADAMIPGVTGVLARSARPADLAAAVAEATALTMQPAVVAPWLRNFDPAVAAARLEMILQSVVADATLEECTSSLRSDLSPASKAECPPS